MWLTDLLSHALGLGGRMLMAAILGVLISYRRDMDRRRQSVLQAHAFLAVAGTLLIVVIGDQIERAVAIIGVASVIRYRYVLRNPKDASTLIIALGLGMACGAGLVGMAAIGALFVVLISRLFDFLPQALPEALLHPLRETEFRIITTDPDTTLGKLERIFKSAQINYSLTSLERKQRDIGPPQTVIEGVVRVNGDLQVTDLTANLVDDSVLQISWKEMNPFSDG
jgi:uncharacterized membrane protein YhiD involved in acid resistance